jgi:hypothetical protein
MRERERDTFALFTAMLKTCRALNEPAPFRRRHALKSGVISEEREKKIGKRGGSRHW